MSIDTSSTPARRWVGSLGEGVVDVEDEAVDLEVQRDLSGPGRVAVHTMINGTGSHASYYLDREAAIELAARLLLAVQAGS
jgi:hypothetical protein